MPHPDRRWLAVPYPEHWAAKDAGAEYDWTARCWYDPTPDSPSLHQWLPSRPVRVRPANSRPRNERRWPTEEETARAVASAVELYGHCPEPPEAPQTVVRTDIVEPDYGWLDDPWEDLAARPAGYLLMQEAARRRARREQDLTWRQGAAGEDAFVRAFTGLTKPYGFAAFLRDRGVGGQWRLLSSLPNGPCGGDIDHLIIGPSGLMIVDTKNLAPWGRVDITSTEVWVGRRRQNYVEKVRYLAAEAAHRLADAAEAVAARCSKDPPDCPLSWNIRGCRSTLEATVAGRPSADGHSNWPPALAAIAITASPIHGQERPPGVLVDRPNDLARRLVGVPAALTDGDVRTLYELARRSTTWTRDVPRRP